MDHLNKKNIISYISEIGNPAELSRIESHISQCADCLCRYENIRGLLSPTAGDRVQVSEVLKERILASYRRMAAEASGTERAPRAVKFKWQYALPAALATIIIVVGIFSLKRYYTEGGKNIAMQLSRVKGDVLLNGRAPSMSDMIQKNGVLRVGRDSSARIFSTAP